MATTAQMLQDVLDGLARLEAKLDEQAGPTFDVGYAKQAILEGQEAPCSEHEWVPYALDPSKRICDRCGLIGDAE